jgi:hypothetical protein
MPPTPQPTTTVLAHETARPGENTGGAFGRGTVEYRMTPTSLVLLADAATTPAVRGVRVRVEHFTHVGRACWLYFIGDDRNAVGSIWSLACGGFTVFNAMTVLTYDARHLSRDPTTSSMTPRRVLFRSC